MHAPPPPDFSPVDPAEWFPEPEESAPSARRSPLWTPRRQRQRKADTRQPNVIGSCTAMMSRSLRQRTIGPDGAESVVSSAIAADRDGEAVRQDPTKMLRPRCRNWCCPACLHWRIAHYMPNVEAHLNAAAWSGQPLRLLVVPNTVRPAPGPGRGSAALAATIFACLMPTIASSSQLTRARAECRSRPRMPSRTSARDWRSGQGVGRRTRSAPAGAGCIPGTNRMRRSVTSGSATGLRGCSTTRSEFSAWSRQLGMRR